MDVTISYSILYVSPNGESGCHPNIPRNGVSISEVNNHPDNIDDELAGTNNLFKVHTMRLLRLGDNVHDVQENGNN